MIRGLAGGALAAAVLWAASLPARLGAHPFWDTQVIWIGTVIGLCAFAITSRWQGLLRTIAFVMATACAVASAYVGKSAFAASFAENALAGQAWYFGWIGACAGCVAAAASVTSAKT